MSLAVRLIVHPYSARKDRGFGHDRYAYELLTRLPAVGVPVSTAQWGRPTGVVSAFVSEARAIASLAFERQRVVFHATATMNSQCAITARCHPLVTTIHDVLWFFVKDKFDSAVKWKLKTLGIRRAARRSDAVIVPFEITRRFLVDELGASASRVHVVPYGVDGAVFYPPRDGERIPRPECFPPGGRIVLFVGALTRSKGADTLVRSFAEIAARVPDAVLVMGSDGADRGLIQSLAEASPARERIRFVGFIPEEGLRAAYCHAEVAVFPSRYGFGLSTLEGMACGTPTVSGRALDAPEFVGEAGLLASPDDPDELAAQVIRIMSDKALARDLSRRGVEKSVKLTWDRTIRETADVYRKVWAA